MSKLLSPIKIGSHTLANRFALAALTNQQSYDDGTISEDEHRWLTARAAGGFSLIHTCACLVHPSGKGFVGQLGIYSDRHIEGLTHLASDLRDRGAYGIVQLHDAGFRTPEDLAVGSIRAPSSLEKYNARAMTKDEVYEAIDHFVQGAVRAEKSGFAGVQVHGAHGYLIAQFLSPSYNRREDEFGGSFANRARFLSLVIEGIRNVVSEHFIVGVRLSAERFGVEVEEMLELVASLGMSNQIDYLDISLWDVKTKASDGELLIDKFVRANNQRIPMGVAGHIYSSDEAQWCLDRGADLVLLGRAGILHYDFPKQFESRGRFTQIDTPVTKEYLQSQYLGPSFIDYMSRWEGFVA